jgi:hypothetical protein
MDRMDRFDSSSLLGGLLVLLGVFLLAQTLGILAITSPAAWSVVFIIVGLAFLSVMLRGRGEWWPLIPGFAFLAIGLITGLQAVAPGLSSAWGGFLFLGLLGVAFVVVYIMQPSNWWAIIPGGTLLTLSLVTLVEGGGRRGSDGGPVFLAGLGLTFLIVYFAPTPKGRMTWAIIPAGVLFVLALLAGIGRSGALNVLWPAVLVGAGLYLVYRALGQRG